MNADTLLYYTRSCSISIHHHHHHLLSLSIYTYLYVLATAGSWCAGWPTTTGWNDVKKKKCCGRVVAHERNEKNKTKQRWLQQPNNSQSECFSIAIRWMSIQMGSVNFDFFFLRKKRRWLHAQEHMTYTHNPTIYRQQQQPVFLLLLIYSKIII